VIHQSAPATPPGRPRSRTFDLALVGHLRPEKDFPTALRALARLPAPTLRLRHAGRVPEDTGGDNFRAAAAADPRVELRGALSHAATRRLIRQCRVLVLPSLMEGGANVIIEAITSGVPVLASRIGGSVGLLGADYPGLFPVGDDAALAALIDRCRSEPDFLAELRQPCATLASLFEPARECEAVNALAHNLLSLNRNRCP
jgi:glycosyltransferase involved in cell wall biosynthesis